MTLPRSLLVNGQSNINPNLSCGYTYGYYWWILAFILIVLLGEHYSVAAPPLLAQHLLSQLCRTGVPPKHNSTLA